ncbi:ADP-ribosylglycohydrolase family protein [Aquibacillus saliphilus]|uniref:ADP-ribosylglycohydrolase family protein n=1 Tax=Aquibacillus saliphilus TaxID=1909422 RepID=UPI001CF0B544|nr:ADP-ribosylglycohydrolase family protein [Aquibacillus saliphilus]
MAKQFKHGVISNMMDSYINKVYGGFLGMSVGVRLGAPVEPPVWSDKLINQVYGNVEGYLKDYKNFAADDDTNGPIFFIRALLDDARNRELEPQDVGKAWLNYSREGIGMFWWGGEGVSTEHTSYMNLKRGISAPRSGSAEVNGLISAEQIGGQIFIDSWGLLFPNDPSKAADYAEKAASVSHDKNGLYGARFMAACISKAFTTKSIDEIIAAGYDEIPSSSTYAELVSAVIKFHENNPDDFRSCRQFLEEEWGYDKYTGVCHIIPNAGVCILSLLYGNGDFSKTIEIATMCGWDTDCNAGNVGTIVGVLNGVQAIPDHYRSPINDALVASSVSGYLNNVDIPTFVKELAALGYRLANENIPEELEKHLNNSELDFDFNLEGSTHGFRSDKSLKVFSRHHKTQGKNGKGSLEIVFDRLLEGDREHVYYKPFYRREDFDDERYKPVFSPKVYSGQTMSLSVLMDKWYGEEVFLIPYVRTTDNKEELFGESVTLKNQEWQDVEFVIPDTKGSLIDEIGFVLESPSPRENRAFGCLYVDRFRVFGKADYTIDFNKQYEEFKCITPFSHNRGEWTLQEGKMIAESDGDATSYTGNYYSSDYELSADLTPLVGEHHSLLFRGMGIQRHYLAGFDGEGQVSLIVNDFGYTRLASTPYEWEKNKSYKFSVYCEADLLTFKINGETVIEYKDDSYKNGMVGIGLIEEGRAEITSFSMVEK